jgi:hypothetical protein
MNCERCRERVSDAAAGVLSARQQKQFDAHVQNCAVCSAEFERSLTLLEAIGRGVAAQVAAEPSPELAARVRRKIAAETATTDAIWAWRIPAAAFAAMIIIVTAMWMMRPHGGKQEQVVKTAPASISPTVANHAAPNQASPGGEAAAPKHFSSIASLRPVAAQKPGRIERAPEVLVPPGQAQAVLQFAAALQSGKLDGAKLMAELQRADQPIEIRPLVIAPLETPGQSDGTASKPPGNNEQENLVGEEKAHNSTN